MIQIKGPKLPKQLVQVSVPEDVYQWLTHASQSAGISKSEVVVQILQQAKDANLVEVEPVIQRKIS